MKRFVVAAVAALAVGLGSAGQADAQLVYGYNNTLGGAYNTGRTFVTPWGYQTYNSSWSPFYGTVQKQVYAADAFGNRMGRSYGAGPLGGYSNGFYQPNPFFNPYNPYGSWYSFANRRFPW